MQTRHKPECDVADDPNGTDLCTTCGRYGRRKWHIVRDDYSDVPNGRMATGDGTYQYKKFIDVEPRRIRQLPGA